MLVGEDPASKVYVGSKTRTCAELGFHSLKIELPAETTRKNSSRLFAISMRILPSTAFSSSRRRPNTSTKRPSFEDIDPRKDVDGFHPENVAKLALEDPTGFVPCTPTGCMKLLEVAGISTPMAPKP